MDTSDETTMKKKRTRTKQLSKNICKQVEFYFSDSNLQKSGFMSSLIDNAEEGYVDLDIILDFNLIKNMSTNKELITRALRKSSSLEFNSDESKIRRKTEILDPRDVDERTIYVEGICRSENHRTLTHFFSRYGAVTYISIPRYRSSKDNKGFCFVEFAHESSVVNASKDYKIDLSKEKIGKFPSSNQQKQLAHLIYNKGYEMPTMVSCSSSLQASPYATPTHDSQATPTHDSQATPTHNSQDTPIKDTPTHDSQATPMEDTPTQATPGQSTLIATNNSESETANEVKGGDLEINNMKRKPSLGAQVDVALKRQKVNKKSNHVIRYYRVITKKQWLELRGQYLEEQKENVVNMQKRLREIRKERMAYKNLVSNGYDHGSEVDQCMDESSSANQDNPTADHTKSSTLAIVTNGCSGDAGAVGKEAGGVGKEVGGVGKEAGGVGKNEGKDAVKLAAKVKPPPAFVANTIIRFTTPEQTQLKRSHVKEQFELLIDHHLKAKAVMDDISVDQSTPSISYIDMLDNDYKCTIRCRDAIVTDILLDKYIVKPGESMVLLSGLEEENYWKKLIEDREKRLTTKKRVKNKTSKLHKMQKNATKIILEPSLKHKHFD